jgi:hypothetical protein
LMTACTQCKCMVVYLLTAALNLTACMGTSCCCCCWFCMKYKACNPWHACSTNREYGHVAYVGRISVFPAHASPLPCTDVLPMHAVHAGLRIKENKEVYEGEVTELTPEYTEGPAAGGGYGKAVSHVVIGLKTVKGTKQLKLDPTIYDALMKVCCVGFGVGLSNSEEGSTYGMSWLVPHTFAMCMGCMA